MHLFRVWAPGSGHVAVRIGRRDIPLVRDEGGWWEASVAEAGVGTDYGFVLEGDAAALPDPRSMSQPHGVHGLSRVVEHASFRWSDENWRAPVFKDAVIYELHIGVFTPEGTFDAAAARLEYLKSLGITHVELMPVAEFPGARGWGYDGVDLFAVEEAYGGPTGLKRFVDAAHAAGLAVLIDVVYNHLGPAGNYLARFGPYFTARYRTPWGDAVNFDRAGSDEVRRFFIDNAKMWLRDYHCDGLRLDAVHAYADHSAIPFLEQLTAEVRSLERSTLRSYAVIAESDLNDPRVIARSDIGGCALDAQWSDDFHHALFALLTGERSGYYADFGRMANLAKALHDGFVYDGRYSVYRGCTHGRPLGGIPLWRLLGYVQNHDQVGNRARGKRLSSLVSCGRTKIAVAVVMTAPFVPLVFQGEEWAASTPFLYFTDHEPALGARVTEGRKDEFAAFGWNPKDVPDPQAEETFERSRLRWSEPTMPEHADMLAWYRALMALRRGNPVDFVDGGVDAVFDEQAGWFTLRRGRFLTAFSIAEQSVRLAALRDAVLLLRSSDEVAVEGGVLTLAPDSVAVLRVDGVVPTRD